MGNRFEDTATGFLYEYDQLNRLKRTYFYLFDSTSMDWMHDTGYNEMLYVDGNGGGVQRYTKDGNVNAQIDEATVYTNGNKLLNIQDGSGDNRGLYTTSSITAFGYDQVGNMTNDVFNHLNIGWNPYNKPSMIFDTVNKHRYTFLYDGMGNMVRSLRVRIPPNPSDPPVYNFYVRDAAGNELALYQTIAGSATTIAERYLYADDMVGVMKGPNNHSGTDTTFPPAEMYVKDHLGTVRATILDTPTTASWVADPNYPDPEVTSYFNGYAYGAPMYDRVYNSLSVAHGFNGQRKMSELNGNVNQAKYWMYDNWLGTRWNVDPVDHPSINPYSVLGSNPIVFIDPEGDDWYKDKTGTLKYDPSVQGKRDVQKGEVYIGDSYSEKTKRGFSDYRRDGSIMFTNETDAYQRMMAVTKQPGGGTKYHEVFGVIMNKGVLVLPDYKNNSTTSEIEAYGYKWKSGKLFDPLSHSSLSFIGTIHTHPLDFLDNGASAGPGIEDQRYFNRLTPDKPYFTIGYDNKLHAATGNKTGTTPLGLPKGYSTINDLKKGASLILLIKSMNRQ